MKKIIIFLTTLFGCISFLNAGEPSKRTNEEAAEYFSSAKKRKETITLTAKEKYTEASMEKKKELISYMLELTETKRAIVETANSSWLWVKDDDIIMSYEMETSKSIINKYNYAQVDRLGERKWFLSFGGEMSYSSEYSMSFNGRIGTYLWKRFLDAGIGFNVGVSAAMDESSDEDAKFNLSTNFTSRLYFTRFFKQWNASPFIGVGIGYTFSPASHFEPLGSVGLNWYLTKGSIDVSIQYGKSSKFGITAGYTISF